MRIALAGHRGFIGRHIQKKFLNDDFISLDRKELYGDVNALSAKIEKAEVVINVAGYSISKRWTKSNRKKIIESRKGISANIAAAIQKAKSKPSLFINASAIGIYAFDGVHDEVNFQYGNGFMYDVVKEWERSVDNLPEETRLIVPRLGLVLGNDGGALPRLLKIFKLGIGGVIASGKQMYSFIHIDDVCDILDFLIKKKGRGVYNLTSPEPVTNQVFTKAIAKALRRPAIFRIPKFVMQIYMGKASEIVTKGHAVYPKKLLDEGYKFTFASIDDAIHKLVSSK